MQRLVMFLGVAVLLVGVAFVASNSEPAFARAPRPPGGPPGASTKKLLRYRSDSFTSAGPRDGPVREIVTPPIEEEKGDAFAWAIKKFPDSGVLDAVLPDRQWTNVRMVMGDGREFEPTEAEYEFLFSVAMRNIGRSDWFGGPNSQKGFGMEWAAKLAGPTGNYSRIDLAPGVYTLTFGEPSRTIEFDVRRGQVTKLRPDNFTEPE